MRSVAVKVSASGRLHLPSEVRKALGPEGIGPRRHHGRGRDQATLTTTGREPRAHSRAGSSVCARGSPRVGGVDRRAAGTRRSREAAEPQPAHAGGRHRARRRAGVLERCRFSTARRCLRSFWRSRVRTLRSEALLPGAKVSAVNLGEVAAKLRDLGMPEATVETVLGGLQIDVRIHDSGCRPGVRLSSPGDPQRRAVARRSRVSRARCRARFASCHGGSQLAERGRGGRRNGTGPIR